LGVYARIETSRGIHKAPAGDEANLRGVLDVAYRLSDVEHDNLVRNASINGIRVVPGAGIVVDASRTLSTDTRWLYVNVRLLFNYVKSSLESGLSWVRQEPNRDRLWNQVKYGSVTPFLLGLYRQGAFGTGTPDEVFTVVCDASNNPPEEVDQGNFKVEIYFYPSKPAETIIIIVGQQPSGGSVAEA
jgi:phage tail sheath protein FI